VLAPLVAAAFAAPPLGFFPVPDLAKLQENLNCGNTPIPPNDDGRIVGGVEAKMNSWPWQVVMCSGSSTTSCRLRCGGSIISPTHILTAAHCVIRLSPSAITIKAGAHKYTDEPGVNGVQQLKVKAIHVHPSYQSPKSFSNDAALLELEEAIEFGPTKQPVCLPVADNGNSLEPKSAFVTGWGSIRSGGSISVPLQQVVVPFVSQQTCTDAYGASTIDDSMVCLGNYEEGGKDSCQGDSGGPVVQKADNGKWYQYGVVSFGRGCALPKFPGVYARVTSFCDLVAAGSGIADICKGGN
jgi:trypsin